MARLRAVPIGEEGSPRPVRGRGSLRDIDAALRERAEFPGRGLRVTSEEGNQRRLKRAANSLAGPRKPGRDVQEGLASAGSIAIIHQELRGQQSGRRGGGGVVAEGDRDAPKHCQAGGVAADRKIAHVHERITIWLHPWTTHAVPCPR